MHERQGFAGGSVENPKKTIWYGIGEALGPDAWRKRVLHIIDTQIIPRANPKWQEWAVKHREEIEIAAANAGVRITVAEIALGSVAVLWGAKKIANLIERSYVDNKIKTRFGSYPPLSFVDTGKQIREKKKPSSIEFFREQLFQQFDRKLGRETTKRLADTVSLLANPLAVTLSQKEWSRIITLANTGGVAVAFGILEKKFTGAFKRAGKVNGWEDKVPKSLEKAYAKSLFLPFLLDLPQIEEIALMGTRNTKLSVQDSLDAIARIRDYTQTKNIRKGFQKQIDKALKGDLSIRDNPRKENIVNSILAKATMADIIRIRRYTRKRPKIRETGIVNGIAHPLIPAVTNSHNSSFPQGVEDALIDSVRKGLDESVLRTQLRSRMKRVGPLISDKKKEAFILHERKRLDSLPVSENLVPYAPITHDFKPEEILAQEQVKPVSFKKLSFKERLRRKIKGIRIPNQSRDFPTHLKEANVPVVLNRREKDLLYNDQGVSPTPHTRNLTDEILKKQRVENNALARDAEVENKYKSKNHPEDYFVRLSKRVLKEKTRIAQRKQNLP